MYFEEKQKITPGGMVKRFWGEKSKLDSISGIDSSGSVNPKLLIIYK